jgi:hypothetical protein
MKVGPLFKFIHERWKIHLKKEAGEPRPWTKDPILRDYRFTTVYREGDKVTKWISEHWREPNQNSGLVWFAMCVARYINWPPTLEAIEYPVPWRRARAVGILEKIRQRPEKIFGGAYKIDAGQSRQIFGGAYFLNSIGPKIQSVLNDRLTPLWADRKLITEQLNRASTLAEIHAIFKARHGFGSFMAAQIVADLKYLPRNLPTANGHMGDWWSWAASGPGSKRGLNRLCGRPVNAPWRETEWHEKLLELQAALAPRLKAAGMPPMHAQDVQGIGCCEWDKHERARLGEGRPKQKYPGRE